MEAKYSVNSDKQLLEAFEQARSYGLRLQAKVVVIVDRDYIWVFPKRNGDFTSIASLKMHWNDLTNADNLNQLKENIDLL